MASLRKTLGITAGLLVLANVSSFTTVALEKLAGFYTPDQAAAVNSLTTDFTNKPGYSLGHQLFYHDGNYTQTGRKLGVRASQ